MVSCCISGCKFRSGRDKGSRFYRIPKVIRHQCNKTFELSERRRNLWIKQINMHRKKLIKYNDGVSLQTRNTDPCVCNIHFLNGRPSHLFDDTNVDWAPSINLGSGDNKIPKKVLQHESRYNRAQKRRQKIKEAAAFLPPTPNIPKKKVQTTKKAAPVMDLECRDIQSKLAPIESVEVPNIKLEPGSEHMEVAVDFNFPIKQEVIEAEYYFEDESLTKEVACQTSVTSDYLEQLERERDDLRREVEELRSGTIVIQRW